jgi:hypothetical protein
LKTGVLDARGKNISSNSSQTNGDFRDDFVWNFEDSDNDDNDDDQDKEYAEDDTASDDDSGNEDDDSDSSERGMKPHRDIDDDGGKDRYMLGWNVRNQRKKRQKERGKSGNNTESVGMVLENINGGAEVIEDVDEDEDVVGDDPPDDYLARHNIIKAIPVEELEKDSFPLHSQNANNSVTVVICMEIWTRDWGTVTGAGFSYLLRDIRCDLSEQVLRRTEMQFANFLTETDEAVLGTAGWTQNTVPFWNSKLTSKSKEDLYYGIMGDVQLRLYSSPRLLVKLSENFLGWTLFSLPRGPILQCPHYFMASSFWISLLLSLVDVC